VTIGVAARKTQKATHCPALLVLVVAASAAITAVYVVLISVGKYATMEPSASVKVVLGVVRVIQNSRLAHTSPQVTGLRPKSFK
jgi:hypothetical protein